MIVYQDLAYCRYTFIWSILFLIGLVNFSPLLSLLIIFILELTSEKYYMTNHKRNGILLSEMFFIVALALKDTRLYIKENMIAIFLYLCYLYIFQVNVITLHMEYLKEDDIQYKNENYWEYLSRVWHSFLFL